MEFLLSVTSKRTWRLSPRSTLPSLTRPPSLMREPVAICFSATSVGELKKTIASLSAVSARATASASTVRAEPIRTRRRFLRVIVTFLVISSAFETQALHELFDLAQLLRLAGERAARVTNCSQCLVAITEHHIGADEPLPSLDIRSIALQALRQPRHHGPHHGDLLFRRELRCRCHILRTRTRSTGDPRDLLANELGPGRIGRCARQHGAPDLDSRRRLAVLLGRNAHEVPRLDVPTIELNGARERLPGFRRKLAITCRHQRLAEPGLPLRGLAVECKSLTPRLDRVFDPAKPQIDGGNHLPATTVVRIAGQMAFDLRNHRVD